MNVHITPRRFPARTLLYTGVGRVRSDGFLLILVPASGGVAEVLPLRLVAEIALDEDGAVP